MGLFDKFKKNDNIFNCMVYDNELDAYTIEIKDIIFESEEEQNEDYINNLNRIADNYRNALNSIIEFMMPDLKLVYGELDPKLVKAKLGKPTIDYDNGIVKYLKQSFDDVHIFIFEFLDDDFQDLQYFSIDG